MASLITVQLVLGLFILRSGGLLLPGQEEIEGYCGPGAIGLGPTNAHRHDPAVSIVKCGTTFVEGAFPDVASGSFSTAVIEFLQRADAENYRHGPLRTKRRQYHLPYEPPFDSLGLLGMDQVLGPLLSAALGDDFVLDLATVVVVPPQAVAQEAHMDSKLEGCVGVHVPLFHLEASHAPLSFCSGTHTWTDDITTPLFHHAYMFNEPGEAFDDAKKRHLCGGQRRFQEIRMITTADDCERLEIASGIAGATIKGFRDLSAEALPWKIGDQITSMNGTSTHDAFAFWKSFGDAEDGPLEIVLQRPLALSPDDQTRKVLGAPLKAGDALLYNSRTWHWGSANSEDSARHVMYLNFKNSSEHPGVHPETLPTPQVRSARASFQTKLQEMLGRTPAEL